jgi:RND superfamily putative drug exporter
VGRGSWWIPRWLDRILPNVDVEGDKLQEHLAQSAPHEDERELVGASK